MKGRVFSVVVISLIIAGCETSPSKPTSGKGPFDVSVFSYSGGPVSGAAIEGGIDWDHFLVYTNAAGIATLPARASGQNAFIYRNNFFPEKVESLSPTRYFIYPTPKSFKPIGNVSGWSIKFDPSLLISLEYDGTYHLYSYSDLGVTEMGSAKLAGAIRETQLHGDNLWFSTHDDGIYVYSLQDPFHPQQLVHLPIPGYLGSFALKDEIVVVGNPWEADSLRVFSYKLSGETEELARFGHNLCIKIAFIDDCLIIVNYYDSLPAIYDLKDPAHPFLAYQGTESTYWFGLLSGRRLILIPKREHISATTRYKIIDLSDPRLPMPAGFFTADSRLVAMINDQTAIGRYYLWEGAVSILSGDFFAGFKTVGIITENTSSDIFLHEFEGSASPYFIVGGRMWKIEGQIH